MKKIIYAMLALMMATFTLTSCEDVPMPYNYPEAGGDDTPSTSEEPKGDGTQANPYNVAGVNQFIAAGTGLDKKVYIEGIVTRTKDISAQYGNATFYISEDGTTSKAEFYVYRCKGLGGNNIAADDEVKVGDKVIIYGTVTNYNGTYETVQNEAYIYSLNGKTSGGDTPTPGGEAKGDGTEANPYNSVAANAYASSLASGAESDKDVYIKGKVVSVKEAYSTQFGNASFYISDDGSADGQFYVFRALYLGNEKYTSGDNVEVGDEVVICGKVTNYMGNTPETAQGKAYLVSIKKGGGSDTPATPEGDVDFLPTSLGLANGTAVTDATLSDGTTLKFDGGGNSAVPKFYTSGNNIRMYPKNTMTVKSTKTIEKIVISCDTYQGTLCNAGGNVGATSGTVAVDGETLVISGCGKTEVTVTNTNTATGTASQIRMTKMSIYYAK